MKPYLRDGDQIEVSVTHQIKIGGDPSWIKYGVVTSVGPDETEQEARERAVTLVNDGVLSTVTETVDAVRKAGH